MPRQATRARGARPGIVVGAVVLVFAALLVVHHLRGNGASHGPRPHPTTTTAPAVLSVGSADCTFVDRSRTTENYVTHQSIPGRRLVTDIYYPTFAGRPGRSATAGAPPAYARGPYPTIFFGAGYRVDPVRYAELLDHWVKAGFVVVAPLFPDANQAAVAAIGNSAVDEADIPNQPGDVAFVTRRVLAASAGQSAGCGVLRGLVDPSELGLAGQSDGATTVAMLAYDQGTVPGTTTTYRSLAAGIDYRAVAVMSGETYGADPYAAPPGSPAALVVQSATDRCNPPVESVDLYAALGGADRWFLAIRNAGHLTPYEGQDAAGLAVVSKVTTAFFAAELRGEHPSASFLAEGNASPGVATLTTGSDVPSWVDVSVGQSSVACYRT